MTRGILAIAIAAASVAFAQPAGGATCTVSSAGGNGQHGGNARGGDGDGSNGSSGSNAAGGAGGGGGISIAVGCIGVADSLNIACGSGAAAALVPTALGMACCPRSRGNRRRRSVR